jgi:hypothetical protein
VYTINTDNQYTQIGATNLGWNSAGFLTSYGSKSYTWDLLYRLATFDASAGANDDYVYKYDAFGCARQAQELMGCESPTR